MKLKLIQFIIAALVLLFLSNCGEEMPSDGGGAMMVTPRMSISSATAMEAESGVSQLTFEVTLSSSSQSVVTAEYNTSDATARAGQDYNAASGTVSFAAGSTSQQIIVEILNDSDDEEDEQFLIQLSAAMGATISSGDAIGTIENFRVVVDNAGEGYITPIDRDGYSLVWNDEFTDDEIDLTRYRHEMGDHGWGNEELQNYTSSSANSYMEDGKLIIEAIEERPGRYTSARIVTQDKFEFAFGRVDIRAKVPTSQGIWPALWMLGSNFPEVGWPACGEIDIMELVGFEPNTVHGTAHYGNQGQGFSINQGAGKTLPPGEIYSDEFHVFSIEWQEDRIDWFMDDERFFTLTRNSVGSEIWRFNHEFFFIMNVAVGGRWPGNPDGTTTFPQQMVIDYIRVFQK